MKTFKLHLIRHGLTAGNLEGRYIGGGTDLPVCDEGRAQLAELQARFEYPAVDTVFSSPMLRAVETANLLFPGAAHQFTVHDLREAHFGVFETARSRSWSRTPTFPSGSRRAPASRPKGPSPPPISTAAAASRCSSCSSI